MPGNSLIRLRARRALTAICALVVLVGLGCNDEDKVQTDEVTGLWHATGIEYVATTGSARVDLIDGGATATLNLGADGTLVYTLSPAGGGAPQVMTGTWQLMGDLGDLMRVSPAGAPWYWVWEVVCKNNTMRLTGAGAEYDFNADGTGEEAEWNLYLER